MREFAFGMNIVFCVIVVFYIMFLILSAFNGDPHVLRFAFSLIALIYTIFNIAGLSE